MDWIPFEDEWGKGFTNGIMKDYRTRTEKYYEDNPMPPVEEPEPQPPTETELLTDYIVDVDYRVTMIELGL